MSDQQYTTVKDDFDRVIGSLTGLQDVLHTQPTIVQVETPFIGNTQQFTIQTFRPEEGDILLLTHSKAGEHHRIVIPVRVIDAIIRQRESLTARGRRIRGKQAALQRKAAGKPWGFENGRKPKRAGKGASK